MKLTINSHGKLVEYFTWYDGNDYMYINNRSIVMRSDQPIKFGA